MTQTEANTERLVAIVNTIRDAHVWSDVVAALTEAAGILTPVPAKPIVPNLWTFYRDSDPSVPYIGADAPYVTSMRGVWRFGGAPNDGIENFKPQLATTVSKELLEYADALEDNPSADNWAKEDFVRDVREWAKYVDAVAVPVPVEPTKPLDPEWKVGDKAIWRNGPGHQSRAVVTIVELYGNMASFETPSWMYERWGDEQLAKLEHIPVEPTTPEGSK